MSDNVTRYSLNEALDPDLAMDLDKHGKYMFYEDGARLLAENAQLRAEVERLRTAFPTARIRSGGKTVHKDECGWNYGHDCTCGLEQP